MTAATMLLVVVLLVCFALPAAWFVGRCIGHGMNKPAPRPPERRRDRAVR